MGEKFPESRISAVRKLLGEENEDRSSPFIISRRRKQPEDLRVVGNLLFVEGFFDLLISIVEVNSRRINGGGTSIVTRSRNGIEFRRFLEKEAERKTIRIKNGLDKRSYAKIEMIRIAVDFFKRRRSELAEAPGAVVSFRIFQRIEAAFLEEEAPHQLVRHPELSFEIGYIGFNLRSVVYFEAFGSLEKFEVFLKFGTLGNFFGKKPWRRRLRYLFGLSRGGLVAGIKRQARKSAGDELPSLTALNSRFLPCSHPFSSRISRILL